MPSHEPRALFPVAEIADWLHPTGSRWKALVMLMAYFDESGTHGEAAVTSIAGYVGTKDAWVSVEREWLAVLGEFADRGVRYFHMTDCLSRRGQFTDLDQDERHGIIYRLSQILGRHDLAPIVSGVVGEAWDIVTDADFLRRFPKPFDLCFDDVLRQLWQWGSEKAKGERIAPMFSHHQEYGKRMSVVGAALDSEPWYSRIVGPIAFGTPEEVVPLQGADLVSHQINLDIDRRVYEVPSLNEGTAAVLARAIGARAIYGHWFDHEGLALTVKRFNETGEIYPMRGRDAKAP